MMTVQRCSWSTSDPIYIAYHDKEWGVPIHDDNTLFEFLTLEGAQAGLSWLTILRKRETYRQVFDGFDPAVVAEYDEAKVAELMANAGIVRNRRKILSAISNARCFLAVQAEHGSFNDYIWSFVDGKPIHNKWRAMEQIPALTPLSEKISKDLHKRGFRFIGPTIIYAHMQATGMVNDHLTGCFRHQELVDLP